MDHHEKKHSAKSVMWEELACHAPYGILAVTLGLTILSIFSALVTTKTIEPLLLKKLSKSLFHTFHFMHIVFAITGAIITHHRFFQHFIRTVLVGIISPSIFCMLSDIILPYVGARILGLSAKMHICFIEEPLRLLPFLCIGLLNGLLMAYYGNRKKWFHSIGSHASHVFISALASVFYLISQGFGGAENTQIGSLFLLLIVAVIIPCTFSDIIIPMHIARGGMHYHEEH